MNLFNLKFLKIIHENNYSNFNNSPKGPLPKKVFNCLDDINIVKSSRSLLKDKWGIYSL